MGEGRFCWQSGAVGAPLCLAPGPTHHARLRRHRRRGLPGLPLSHGRTEPRPHLGGPVPQPDAHPDLHRRLPVFLPAPGADPDVEPGGRSRVLRSASAAGLPTARGAVSAALASPAAALGFDGAGPGVSCLVGIGAQRGLAARRGAAVAARLPGLVRRRYGARGAAADGGARLCVGVRAAGGGVLLHRVDTDRGGADDLAGRVA